MVTGVATGDVMVAVVIGEHHERFAGLHQCFGILHGVAEVDVVVGRTVANQELAMQLVGLAYRTAGVSGGIFLRGAHEAFRVDRVVVTPASRRSHGYSGGEDGTAFAHAHQCVEASVTPTPDTDTRGINVGQRTQIKGGFHLVFCF